MKFGQLAEYYYREIFFFRNQAGNEAEILVLDIFLFFKKALFEVKAK